MLMKWTILELCLRTVLVVLKVGQERYMGYCVVEACNIDMRYVE